MLINLYTQTRADVKFFLVHLNVSTWVGPGGGPRFWVWGEGKSRVWGLGRGGIIQDSNYSFTEHST